mgnify:CR=1 FL=1
MPSIKDLFIASLSVLLLAGVVTVAQETATDDAASSPSAEATEQPDESADSTDTESAEKVLDDLLGLRKDNLIVEPESREIRQVEPARAGEEVGGNDDLGAVIGVAPGGRKPELRREGEYVINRRGRVVRSPAGNQMIFVFEADGKESADPPMIIHPCRNLQIIEDMIAERGDRLVFVVTGQVFAYRGVNYLLPTSFRQVHARGNLDAGGP